MTNQATIWLTGLPASGKTTLANALCTALRAQNHQAVVLDGDALRQGLSADLGFSEQDRHEHVRRVGTLTSLLNQQGVYALVSLISPYRASRDAVRLEHAQQGITFLEVFVDTPLDICMQRDPKGLYAKALAGKVKHVTGIDAPYEQPLNPDLVIHTPSLSVEEAVALIMKKLNIISTR